MDRPVMEWWLQVLVIAVCASGLIQYGKGVLKAAPWWVWAAALPVLCIALAQAPWWILLSLMSLAVAQLGYDALLKGLLAWAKGRGMPEVSIPSVWLPTETGSVPASVTTTASTAPTP